MTRLALCAAGRSCATRPAARCRPRRGQPPVAEACSQLTRYARTRGFVGVEPSRCELSADLAGQMRNAAPAGAVDVLQARAAVRSQRVAQAGRRRELIGRAVVQVPAFDGFQQTQHRGIGHLVFLDHLARNRQQGGHVRIDVVAMQHPLEIVERELAVTVEQLPQSPGTTSCHPCRRSPVRDRRDTTNRPADCWRG